MAAHQAPPSLGFSRHEHWSGYTELLLDTSSVHRNITRFITWHFTVSLSWLCTEETDWGTSKFRKAVTGTARCYDCFPVYTTWMWWFGLFKVVKVKPVRPGVNIHFLNPLQLNVGGGSMLPLQDASCLQDTLLPMTTTSTAPGW